MAPEVELGRRPAPGMSFVLTAFVGEGVDVESCLFSFALTTDAAGCVVTTLAAADAPVDAGGLGINLVSDMDLVVGLDLVTGVDLVWRMGLVTDTDKGSGGEEGRWGAARLEFCNAETSGRRPGVLAGEPGGSIRLKMLEGGLGEGLGRASGVAFPLIGVVLRAGSALYSDTAERMGS